MLNLTYREFKRVNDDLKASSKSRIKIISSSVKNNTVTIQLEGIIQENIPIQSIVDYVYNNKFGALINPSKIKGWKGFEYEFKLR